MFTYNSYLSRSEGGGGFKAAMEKLRLSASFFHYMPLLRDE
jgi:hypothetical protein